MHPTLTDQCMCAGHPPYLSWEELEIFNPQQKGFLGKKRLLSSNESKELWKGTAKTANSYSISATLKAPGLALTTL